uniref:Uncharacterized protein n=1 Tax=Nelumbo nucifera TaxID=4432 RepID=A0A822YVC2_NELNU|nr:TPA_asm: hypothetical protein HUJ06_005695 [Nelumbo nucifera]
MGLLQIEVKLTLVAVAVFFMIIYLFLLYVHCINFACTIKSISRSTHLSLPACHFPRSSEFQTLFCV